MTRFVISGRAGAADAFEPRLAANERLAVVDLRVGNTTEVGLGIGKVLKEAVKLQLAPTEVGVSNDGEWFRDGPEVRAAIATHVHEKSHPVANVGEGASGADAAASDDPASREADDADRQQLAASGFTGGAAVASQKTLPDADGPEREATAANFQADPDKSAEVETSAAPVAPGKRRWNFTDKAHPDCLNPEQCGGFSNHGLCERCKAAA